VEALSLLSEMRRVVIPGGVVALIVPDYLALREDFWNCDYSHSFVTTRRRLLQMYHDAELMVIEQRSLYGPLTGTVGWLGGYYAWWWNDGRYCTNDSGDIGGETV